MKKSTRILLAFAMAELMLAAIWWWLLAGLQSGSLNAAGDLADTASTVSSIMGGAMGVFGALCLATWFAARRKER